MFARMYLSFIHYLAQKAFDVDPYDLESLMYLGVSCTNELKEGEAMNHLENWLRYHPSYSNLEFPPVVPQDDEEKRIMLQKLFHEAANINPHDENVLVAIGVLFFIDRDYSNAAQFFQRAIREK